MSGQLFVSYSRKEFHFTESLVQRLRTEGINVCFDAEDLVPGLEWKEEISGNLAACNAVVLVVSEARLSSEYVRREWTEALGSKKPIFLILFEATELPLELRHESIADFRTNFNAGFAQLVQRIRNPQGSTVPIPPQSKINLLNRRPVIIDLAAGTLFAAGIAGIALWTMFLFRLTTSPGNLATSILAEEYKHFCFLAVRRCLCTYQCRDVALSQSSRQQSEAL